MSLFTPSQGSQGIFAPTGCDGTLEQPVSFVRNAALARHTFPVQNAAGEVLLSYIPVGTFTLQCEPVPAGYTRMLQGIVIQVDVRMYGLGYVDVQEGDRCYFQGKQLEITNALHYGQHHTELELQHIGR